MHRQRVIAVRVTHVPRLLKHFGRLQFVQNLQSGNNTIEIVYRVFYFGSFACSGDLPAEFQRQSPKIWGCHPDVLWWQSPSNCTKLATILRLKWATRALRSQFFYLSLCDQPKTQNEGEREKARDENTVEREIKLRGNPSKQWVIPQS